MSATRQNLREAAERLVEGYDASERGDDLDLWVEELRDALEAEPVELAKPGRPSKLNEATAAVIVSHVRNGSSLADAAALAEVGERTVQRWMHLGRVGADGDEDFVDFAERVKQAKADRKRELIEEIGQGRLITGEMDWKAKAWLAERLYPEDFAKTVTQRRIVVQEMHVTFAAMRGHMKPESYAEMIEAFAITEGVDVEDDDDS